MFWSRGRRGAAGVAPENTLPGFKSAWEAGCHSVELDVYLTRDGELAVIHDETVDRTTDGTRRVDQFTMDELRLLDAGGGHEVRSLSNVISLLEPTALTIQIELKGTDTEQPAVRLTTERGFLRRVRFTSFDADRTRRVGALPAGAGIGILINKLPEDLFAHFAATGASHPHVEQSLNPTEIISAAHDRGIAVTAFGSIIRDSTVDRLVDLNVDQMGSDVPQLVIDRFRQHGRYAPPR